MCQLSPGGGEGGCRCVSAAGGTPAGFDPATPTEVEGDGWKNMGKNKGKRFIADKTGFPSLQTSEIKTKPGKAIKGRNNKCFDVE